MPSVIGAVNINSNSGAVAFGDALNISPKSNSKTFTGAGSDNTGNIVVTNTAISMTNTFDPHVADEVQVGNL